MLDFETLYRSRRTYVLTHAYRIVRDARDAEEVAREVWLRVHANLAAFRQECEPWSWIYRVTMNACFDLLRARRRFAARGQHVDYEPHANTLLDASPDPLERLLVAERHAQLLAALGRLSDRERQALTLIFLRGLTYEEAAAASGINLGTLKSRAHRGRQHLAAALARN